MGLPIIRFRTQDYFRRHKRRGNMVALHDSLSELSYNADIDKALSLRQSLDALEPQDRQLLILFYIDGFTGTEISAATGWPHGTVKSKLFKIRQQLKDKFNTEGDHNE